MIVCKYIGETLSLAIADSSITFTLPSAIAIKLGLKGRPNLSNYQYIKWHLNNLAISSAKTTRHAVG